MTEPARAHEFTVILGDLQIPYHDHRAVSTVIKFINLINPGKVVLIGDVLDLPAPSKYSRGTVDEYCSTIQKEVNQGRKFLRDLRKRFSGSIGYHTGSNHELRLNTYLSQKAPALLPLEALKISNLLGFSEFGVDELPLFADLIPGWVTTHGHVPKVLSKVAGGTALAISKRLGKNVICGHTHRLGLISEKVGGKILTGVETGHLMDEKKAAYTSFPNWQPGLVLFDNRWGGHAVPYPLDVVRRFVKDTEWALDDYEE